MRQAYRVLAGLIALGVVAQASFIALGWFTALHDVDEGTLTINKDYDGNIGHSLHGIVGFNVLPLLALVLMIVSFFAKIPGGVKWAGFTLLAVVVQVVLAFVAFGVPAIGALHGINALIVLGVAGNTARRAAMVDRAPVTTQQAATV